jgi:hypothetical protein
VLKQDGSRFRAIAHLSDDKAVAKMGHPVSWCGLDFLGERKMRATRPVLVIGIVHIVGFGLTHVEFCSDKFCQLGNNPLKGSSETELNTG